MSFLRVWHEEQLVGILSGTRDKVSFQYDPDWTQNGFALSLAMPLREESYGDEATRAYFSNLMPEEHILAMLCRSGKMAGHDLMSFFRLYGRECAGAIALSEGENPPSENGEERDVTDQVQEYLAGKTGGPLPLAVRSRLSLAGAQDKLPVVIRHGRLLLSSGSSTHIIKPDISGYPHSARNEHFCLEFSAAMGCETVKSRLMQFAEGEVLAISRYDRRVENGQVILLHQQDFCQALGLPPVCKYQGQGEFFGFPHMLQVCRDNDIPVGEFFARARILNWIIGNCDAHAKNFSLVACENGLSLAPFYDVLCTAIYPGLDKEMGTAFGRHILREDVDEGDLRGEDVGIDDEEHRMLARQMAESGADIASGIARAHGRIYGSCEAIGKIVDEIAASCGKMLSLTEKISYSLRPHGR